MAAQDQSTNLFMPNYSSPVLKLCSGLMNCQQQKRGITDVLASNGRCVSWVVAAQILHQNR
jgi:hypothetical protein